MGGIVNGRMFVVLSCCLVFVAGLFVGSLVARVLFRLLVYPLFWQQEIMEQFVRMCILD